MKLARWSDWEEPWDKEATHWVGFQDKALPTPGPGARGTRASRAPPTADARGARAQAAEPRASQQG